MHPRGALSAAQSRRLGLRGTDALPGARSRRARLAVTGPRARPLLRRRHGIRLPGHREHVPVEPGRGDLHRHHGRRRQLLRRTWLADRPVAGRGRSSGDHRRHPVHRPDDGEAGSHDGGALRGAGAADDHSQRRPAARGDRGNLERSVHLAGNGRRRAGCAGHRLPARRLLQRGGAGQRRHRPCHGAHAATGERGLRRPARAVHRHRGDLHPLGSRHHHDGLRSGARHGQHQRYRADYPGLCFHAALVAGAPGRRGHHVRFLDDDRMGLLRPQGVHLPVGGRTPPAPRLQRRLLRVRRGRGEPQPRSAHRPVGRPGVRGRHPEPDRALPDGSDRPARDRSTATGRDRCPRPVCYTEFPTWRGPFRLPPMRCGGPDVDPKPGRVGPKT